MKLGSSVIQDKKKVNTKQENGKEKKMSTFHDLKASEAV